MDSHRDRFHEANILLSNTLKQLDEVMGKGSMQDLPTIMSSSAHGRLNGNLMAEDFKNGNPKSAFTIVDQMSNSRHGDLNANHGIETSLRISRTISTPDQRVSDPSSTWEENANKDTNSIDSMAESSTGESPLSDAQSSSNESTTFTMDKLLKAIEMDKLPAPNSQARYKILKWVYENDGNECLASILSMSFSDLNFQGGKIRRNSVPYAQHGARPASERLVEELLRTRPIGELQHATQSATSVYGSLLRNSNSGASITFRDRDGRPNPHRSSSTTTTSSSSRIIRPYATHYSDSGFSSASSCGHLPPPPPYRFHFRSSTSGSDGLSESTSTPKLITLTSGAIRIGGGALPPELCSVINNSDSVATNSQFDQATFPQLVALQQQEFNSQFAQQDLDFEEGFRKSQNAHRIHRSLSDSKYGQNEPIQKMGRLLNSGSQNSAIVSSMNEQNQLTLASSSFQQSKIGNSDPYVSNRGASWTHSQISLSPSPSMVSTVSCPEYPELQEKLRRLAITRDTLSLQVAVLHDQVGAQKEKIRDLETQLDSKRKLYSYEALTNTNQPSTHKTDLLNEIGDLKNRFQMVQREKIEAEKRLQSSQAEIERLTNSIQTLMSQHNIPVQRLLNNMPTNGSNTDENQEMEQLKMIVQKLMADNEKKKLEISSLRSQLSKGSPISRLHQNGYISDENGVIMGLNAERSTPTNTDQHKLSNGASPAPTPPFMNQKPTQPLDINTQLRKLLVDDEIKENMAHSNSFPASLCSTLGNGQPPFQHQHTGSFVPPGRSQIPPSTSYLSSLSAGAAPTSNSVQQTAWMTPRNQLHHTTSLFAQPTHSQAFADGIHGPASPAARQLAAELDEIRRVSNDSQMRLPQSNLFASTSLPRTLHSKSTSALSLPRSKLTLATNGASSSTIGSEFSFLPPMVHRRGSSVLDSTNGGGSQPSFKGQGFLQRWLGRSARNLSTLTDKQGKQSLKSRSRSEPHLCPRRNAVDSLRDEQLTNTSNESDQPTESDDELTRSRVPSNATSHGKFKRGRGRSTLRNIFGKLTRSTSQEIRAPNFNRGNGIRSSASARVVSLGAPLTGNIPIRPLVNQFCDWSTEVVCEWLAEIGFGTYIPDAERSIRSGRHLLNMTAIDLEKEVGIKNLLHRKKLRCLLNCIERNTLNAMEPADRLDVHQTLLWLDDLGLPQFRDIFAENMIDGQMLLCLTVQDLVEMKVVSAMNHATIARGIQFLRSVDFNTHQLKKTFTGDASQMNQCPEEVEKWAHSCVIQWLKNIDLAEFTPNLMFSGIHGALMVHDPTFTAESLAEVLQIPAHKTLLRRHLTTHFNNIVGSEIISYKRELLTQPNVTFLAPALRIRLLKKGFSLGRKRDKNIIYVEPDYPVCPADVSTLLSSSRSSNSFVDTSNV